MRRLLLSLLTGLILVCNINAQEAVDLGLSVKWANMNIGASSIYDFGEYFAWGETETKEDKYFTWENYFDTEIVSSKITKMKKFNWRGYNSIKGHSTYDVATKRLGGHWRMPTPDEFKELAENCKIQLIHDKAKDIYYWEFIAKNGNSIIVPVCGHRMRYGIIRGTYFWTSKLYEHRDNDAYAAELSDGFVGAPWAIQHMQRCFGLVVRPVCDEKSASSNYDKTVKSSSSTEKRTSNTQIEELEKEAKGGNYYAKRKLAYEYINGEHVEKNLDKAIKYSVDVIEQVPNNPEIQKFLMANRKRVFSNISYVQRLSKLANPTWNTDDPWCQFLLFAAAVSGNSDVVYNQLENSKNYNLNSRLEWLLWASKQYNYHAMFQLSELYLDSSNKLFDVEKGIMWLTKAADAGHRIARQQLGYYYKKGIFVEKDKKKAKMYLND